MNEIIVSKKVSAKTGKPYVVLAVDLGYTDKPLSFDTATIAEVCGCHVAELMTREVGSRVVVGHMGGDD